MTSQDFTTSFSVNATPADVFRAITNVRGWWTGDIEGSTEKVGDEFTYRYQDVHRSTQEITELVPDKRVVWRVLDADLTFVGNRREWVGTDITFDITPRGTQTHVHFTHVGLHEEFECFDNCSNAWSFYINGSLRRLITSGEGPAAPPWLESSLGQPAASARGTVGISLARGLA
jgi:uncharacterized protein YndB with AHSA1/START domain